MSDRSPTDREITVAFVGNPNAGKSTLFNNLTGAHAKVANYPGVTVEKKEGRCTHQGRPLRVVDLPGAYGLTPYSIEEIVARNFILDEKPDVIVDVVDVSNLERNLYLTMQLIETARPLVLVFNMSDVAQARGQRINLQRLSELLGAPIVETVGHRNIGTEAILDAVCRTADAQASYVPRKVPFGKEIEEEIDRLMQRLTDAADRLAGVPVRWAAIKLIEGDAEFLKRLDRPDIAAAAEQSRRHLRRIFGEEPEIVVAEQRYGAISGACQEAVVSPVELRHTTSDKIDTVLIHPVLGLPIFLALMLGIFGVIFEIGEPMTGVLESVLAALAARVSALLPAGRLESLIVDGIIQGVGGVVVFVPNIALLFMAIAILEDSGYMARAAFVMDRLMHRLGLHGKSFVPMLLGFGCSVPGVMAARILDNERDRLTTILVVPLLSCGARMPVYLLLAGAFFPQRKMWAVFAIYVLGILAAVFMARLFRRFLFRGDTTPLVMELPLYRLPTARAVLIHTWERTWLFLRKAGTVILALAMGMWFLSAFPSQPERDRAYEEGIAAAAVRGDSAEAARIEQRMAHDRLQGSYAARLGRWVSPVMKPVGLGDWRVVTALVAGFGAKEMVVSTLATLYSIGERDDSQLLIVALRQDPTFNPLVAFTLMVFVLLYVPCLPTVAVVGRETHSLRWPLFLMVYMTALAWIASLIVYQGGRLLQLG